MAQITKNLTLDVVITGYSASDLASAAPGFRLSFALVRTDNQAVVGGHALATSNGKIIDERGNEVAASIPAAFTNAKTAFEAQLATLLANAVAAGKIDL